MKDEETLGANWEKVQSTLEGVLPTIKANLDSWTNICVPELEKNMRPEAQAKLAEAILATQALFVK